MRKKTGKKFRGDGPQNSSHEDPFQIGAACPREQINACDERPSLGSAARRTGRYLCSALRYEEGGTERRARAIARIVQSRKPVLRPPPAATVPQSAAAPRVTGAPIVTRQPQMHRRSHVHRHRGSSSAGAPSSACSIASTCASSDWIVTIRKISSLSRRSCIA